MKDINAVIYDMDGLIIDSEPFWRKAEIEVFQTVGLQLTERDCMETTGFRFDEVIDLWFHRQPWTGKSKQQVHDEVLERMEAAILNDAVLMDGVEESLRFFESRQMKMAIASSSAFRLIEACSKKLHRESVFHHLVSAENEIYGKPHPAVFLRAAEILGVEPKHCLVLEDSVNGVIAAKAAKMKCIAIPHPEEFHNPKFAIADMKVRSLKEVPGVFLNAFAG
ncbi:MAG: hexitol phosphatase HxpB [Chitinophagales bacterium]